MDPQQVQQIVNMSPILQWGFGGLCLLLLGIVVWLIKQLLTVLSDAKDVIGGNTQALRDSNEIAASTRTMLESLKDRLLSRPCLRDECPTAK